MTNTYRANLTMLISMILIFLGPIFIRFSSEKLAMTLPHYLYILIPCIIYGLVKRQSFKETFRIRAIKLRSLLILTAISFTMKPFLGLISTVAAKVFGSTVIDSIEKSTGNMSFSLMFFAIAITPAICEEALLRGVIMDGYRRVSLWKMLILNGLLFGLFHMNLQQFAYTFFMGILLAYTVYITDSILAGVWIHLLNNGFSVILMYLTRFFGEDTSTAALEGEPTNFVVLTIIAIVSLAITLFLLKALKKNNLEKHSFREEIIEEEEFMNWPFIVTIVMSSILTILVTALGKLAEVLS